MAARELPPFGPVDVRLVKEQLLLLGHDVPDAEIAAFVRRLGAAPLAGAEQAEPGGGGSEAVFGPAARSAPGPTSWGSLQEAGAVAATAATADAVPNYSGTADQHSPKRRPPPMPPASGRAPAAARPTLDQRCRKFLARLAERPGTRELLVQQRWRQQLVAQEAAAGGNGCSRQLPDSGPSAPASGGTSDASSTSGSTGGGSSRSSKSRDLLNAAKDAGDLQGRLAAWRQAVTAAAAGAQQEPQETQHDTDQQQPQGRKQQRQWETQRQQEEQETWQEAPPERPKAEQHRGPAPAEQRQPQELPAAQSSWLGADSDSVPLMRLRRSTAAGTHAEGPGAKAVEGPAAAGLLRQARGSWQQCATPRAHHALHRGGRPAAGSVLGPDTRPRWGPSGRDLGVGGTMYSSTGKDPLFNAPQAPLRPACAPSRPPAASAAPAAAAAAAAAAVPAAPKMPRLERPTATQVCSGTCEGKGGVGGSRGISSNSNSARRDAAPQPRASAQARRPRLTDAADAYSQALSRGGGAQRSTAVAPGVRRTDRVARFQAMHEAWRQDRFLVSRDGRVAGGCHARTEQ